MATDYQEAIRILSEQEKILQFDSFTSEVYFCVYEKNYEQSSKLGIPIKEVPIRNRFVLMSI